MRILCIAVAAIVAALAQAAPAAGPRAVALLVTVGPQPPEVEALLAEAGRLGLDSVRADNPGASDLRAALARFAAAARAADAAVIVVSAPVLRFGGRDFIAPADLALGRPGDLLTRAVSLAALARAAHLATGGGAVIVLPQAGSATLPDGVRPADSAPEAGPDRSPYLYVRPVAVPGVTAVLAAAAVAETVELGALLGLGDAVAGAELAGTLAGRVIFRGGKIAAPPELPSAVHAVLAPRADPGRDPGTVPAAAPAPALAPPAPETAVPPTAARALGLDDLVALESSLPRDGRRAIQRALNQRGFYDGKFDGQFGERTRVAIRRYQESERTEATGYLTPEQIAKLL